MSGHTPGPWFAKELYGGDRRWVVLHAEPINGGSFKRRIDWSGQMNEADARLIAAAPELLAALQDMLRNFPVDLDLSRAGWDSGDIEIARRAYDNARAIFLKATNQQGGNHD